MKTVKTYRAQIWVGFKVRETGELHTIEEAHKIAQDYCDKVGLCVSVTPTNYIYTNGNEDGCCVGLINYPRFLEKRKTITKRAIDLARLLMNAFSQMKVTIVCDGKTYMLSKEPAGRDKE
jgi:ferredoxin